MSRGNTFIYCASIVRVSLFVKYATVPSGILSKQWPADSICKNKIYFKLSNLAIGMGSIFLTYSFEMRNPEQWKKTTKPAGYLCSEVHVIWILLHVLIFEIFIFRYFHPHIVFLRLLLKSKLIFFKKEGMKNGACAFLYYVRRATIQYETSFVSADLLWISRDSISSDFFIPFNHS